MLQSVLLCAVLSAVLVLLGGLLFAWLLLPLRPGALYSVLPAKGAGEGLEQQCRAYLFLKHLGVFRQELLLVDLGLVESGRDLAGRLAELDPAIQLCTPEQLLEIISN